MVKEYSSVLFHNIYMKKRIIVVMPVGFYLLVFHVPDDLPSRLD